MTIVGLAWMAAAGCTKTHDAPPECSAPQGSAADQQSLAASDTAFAVSLLPPAVAAAGAGGNVIVSPYSLSTALMMVDVGAAGETDAQLQSALHLTANGAALAPARASLACADETDGASNGGTLSIANAVWGQQGFAFSSSFLSSLSTGYAAPLQQADFEHATSDALATINGWVSSETQGQIPSLLQSGDVDPLTRLVLVNAIYFKGAWDKGFDPNATRGMPFTLADGTQATVPTMDGTMNVRQTAGAGAALYELPYKGGDIAMDFLVPGTGSTLATLEGGLTPASLGGMIGQLGSAESAEVRLPKFSFTTRLGLIPVLQTLGVTDAFDPQKANLSGMDGATDLYVATVVQQAIVEVDESGTVAAAATGAGVQAGAIQEPPLVAIDRPFVFLIRDTKTGSILFVGQVQDPRQTT
jgi:serpin B